MHQISLCARQLCSYCCISFYVFVCIGLYYGQCYYILLNLEINEGCSHSLTISWCKYTSYMNKMVLKYLTICNNGMKVVLKWLIYTKCSNCISNGIEMVNLQ